MSIRVLTKGLKYIEIPAFTVSSIAQLGNTYCVKKFFYSITSKISFPRIVNSPEDANFVACVWWIDDDGDVQRRKIWTNNNQRLYVPRYSHDILATTFAIEIWPLDGETSIAFEGLQIETSNFVIPISPSCPVDISTADQYLYTLGTDPEFDLATNTWSGVDGDSWTVDSLGFTTFVDQTSFALNTPTSLTWTYIAEDYGTFGWTDENGGVTQHEIRIVYAPEDLDTTVTVEAGITSYNSEEAAAGTVYYVRAKSGTDYSDWATITLDGENIP